ncbi:uncharacterized protein LOC126679495 [Mercurialis annua]|uniref:uncharacterized protein LOC126679495 n=1 Tax=Mercurialis annua TaxID=3986 RepID=UPI00215E3E7C|nr:uncharacterized protein LOC126679495 [Mercurialis annua]
MIVIKVTEMEAKEEVREEEEIQLDHHEINPPPPSSTCPVASPDLDESDDTESLNSDMSQKKEIFKALEVVERDSAAIAESFTGLFASLRLALSEVTCNSVDHMQCFGEATGRLQESVLDAATKGNRYINSCLRLNEEMKGVDTLAAQLKILRRNVDTLDTAANRLLRFP